MKLIPNILKSKIAQKNVIYTNQTEYLHVFASLKMDFIILGFFFNYLNIKVVMHIIFFSLTLKAYKNKCNVFLEHTLYHNKLPIPLLSLKRLMGRVGKTG